MMMGSCLNINFLAIRFCVFVFLGFHVLDVVRAAAAGPVSSSRVVASALDKETVKVGLLVDNSTMVGSRVSRFVDMALSDFYDDHGSYRTRLFLRRRNPKDDVVVAASAALDLMEAEQVHAIIGPEWSTQAKFMIDLANRSHVPIISFSATSPSLSPALNEYFVRTAFDDSYQLKAIAAVIQAFGWKEVVPIYENTDYGSGLIPYIIDYFQEIDIRVPYRSAISPSSQDIEIQEELNQIMTKQGARVFLVHMTASLGSRLFSIADEAGMLNQETVWIVTDGLSSLLDPVQSGVTESSMQGVIGVRPYLPMSSRLQEVMKKHKIVDGVNLFALWAYDTIWALAYAAEKAWDPTRSRYIRRNDTLAGGTVDLTAMGISELGPEILTRLRNYTFEGLSGGFQLVNGQLQSSLFEVFNVVGNKERVIGYWTPQHGLSKVQNNSLIHDQQYSTSVDNLKPPIWPGDTLQPPKGWEVPVKGKRITVGVPYRKGFRELFRIDADPNTNALSYSGFAHDVFIEVLGKLPFALNYNFKPFNGTYDHMLYQIKLGVFDMVVGDTTIVASRSNYVDFSLPYSESGVSMLVAIKDDERRNLWIFLRPLQWDLWLTTGLAFVFTGCIIWVLERHNDEDFQGSWRERLSLSLWFSFSTLVFAQRERVRNKWTRLVLVIWMFVVLIITQSYTASLASFLTVQSLEPKFIDVQDLVRTQQYVGYQNNSFVGDLLVRALNFDESKLIPYSSIEEYHDALTKGSGNGGVAAIFDEIPYLDLFLAKYCKKYMLVGPTYKTDGFGFAFPLGSPLVPYVSRAILNVTEDYKKMETIEKKYSMRPDSSCQDMKGQDTASIATGNPSLGVSSFGGLFIITGVTSLVALLGELLFSNWHRISSLASRYRNSRPFLVFTSASSIMEIANKVSLFSVSPPPLGRNASRVVPLASTPT